MSNKSLYLAFLYRFSQHWELRLLPDFISKLELMGANVCEAFSRNGAIDISKSGWANKVARSNLEDLRQADGLFAIFNGSPPDEGLMVEK